MKLQSCSRRFALAAITLSAMTALPAIGQTISEDMKLLPSDGAAGDWFGTSVAISGSTVVVGADWDDDNGPLSGSVYLFDTRTGHQIFKLLPSDGAEGDLFGDSVAISGSTAVVGAPFDNGDQSGSAYLFETTTGQQIAKLLPDDGEVGALFGESVAISGSTVVIGADRDNDNGPLSGSAYVFDTTNGLQVAKLLPSDGTQFDFFGESVGISGAVAVVGAPLDNDNGARSGSAYLFDTATGQQIAKLLPSDGAAFDEFGACVAISGTTAVVGARYDDNYGDDSGSAYLFDTNTGLQIAKLMPSDGAAGDEFGHSVAISGTTVVVGALRNDDNGTRSGSAYIFDITTGEQVAKLVPSDGAADDLFGSSVTISGSSIVVGTPFDSDNGSESGSAYVFTAASSCPADLNDDGALDFLDVSAFLKAYAANDPAADLNGDGAFNFFDVSVFLTEFLAGCP